MMEKINEKAVIVPEDWLHPDADELIIEDLRCKFLF